MTDKTVDDFAAQGREAMERGNAMLAKANELTQGYFAALAESSRIFAEGVQALGKQYVDDGKGAFEEAQSSLQKFTTVKSPNEFTELYSENLRKGFDAFSAQISKQGEATIKLVSEAYQPISEQVNTAVEAAKVGKAA